VTLKRVLALLVIVGLLLAYREYRLAQVPDPAVR
jgi:hypothetical protein